MLILTRHHDQVIHIGDDIKLKILEIRGHQVRIGIDAPRHVAIYRDEIYQHLHARTGDLPESDPEKS